jgi:hypothetical protein
MYNVKVRNQSQIVNYNKPGHLRLKVDYMDLTHHFIADVLLIKLKVLQVTTGQQKTSAVGYIMTKSS